MPQNSVPYAVARIHSIERDALDAARVERLLAASTYDEAIKTLGEIGWSGQDGGDAESIAAERVRKACHMVRKLTPSPDATDCFLLRYDALNLKTLLKARCLGQPATFLSDCGVYPVELLGHCVAEHQYKQLPEVLKTALDALEKKLAVRVDALAIDVTVDRAIFALIQQKLHSVKSDVIRGYFAARADMLTAITLLRIRRMGRDAAFFEEMLLPGGTVPAAKWIEAAQKPEMVVKLLAPYGPRVRAAAAAAVQDAAKLPALEKVMDDALLSRFSALKRACLQIEPVVGHILGAEREAAAVRLILAGKANGFAPEAIRERLRDLYGE